MVKIALVDDEESCAARIKEFVERFERETGEKTEVRWFRDGMAFLDEYMPDYDIVLMDIDMPHINGIKTAKKLREIDSMVALVFVSVMVQFAIDGYSVDAMDFLVKPVSYLNFKLKFTKAIEYSKKNRKVIYKLVGDDATMQFVCAPDIYYIESVGHYIYFHTSKGVFKRVGAISQIENELADYGFLRSEGSFVINPAYVTKIGKDFIVVQSTEIPLSRSRKKEFMLKFTGYHKYVY